MSKLNIGTILEATADWSIRDIEDLDNGQVIITVEKPSKGTYNKDGNIVTPLEHREKTHNGRTHIPSPDKPSIAEQEVQNLLKRVEETGISPQGKYFIIMTIDGYWINHPNLRQNPETHPSLKVAAALECDEKGNIIESGLSIEFRINTNSSVYLQNGSAALNNPEIKGDRTVQLGDFTPR